MVVGRFVFQAKWGQADQSVEDFKNMAEIMKKAGNNNRVRILTDLSGSFNTVVQELEFESLADWERSRAEMFASPEFEEMQQEKEDPFESGRAEFYTLEAEL